jgi:hypothetical protein
MQLKFTYIIIIALVAALLLQRSCDTNESDKEVVTKTKVEWKTITTTTPVYVPKWRTKVEIDIDTFTVPIDTNAILRDYYAIYNYIDTVGTDSIKIVINDTITTNKIASRVVSYDIKYPIITTTKEIFVNKRQFYQGFGLGGNTTGLNYLGYEFLYKDKKRNAFGLGAGVDNNLKPTANVKMYWKIGK